MKHEEDTVPGAAPERLNYAEGVLLGAEDFRAEQTYHRGRLARALAFIAGHGTVAGLEVAWEAAVESPPGPGRLRVSPGLAIDRVGRLIELERARCLELERWYQSQTPEALDGAWHEADAFWSGAPSGVAADLYLRFSVCGVGKTPAFSSSAADSFNSVVDARLRDSAELELRPFFRGEASPVELPGDDFGHDRQRLREAIHAAWAERTAWLEEEEGAGESDLLLARVLIPADRGGAGEPPARRDEEVKVRNDLRPFVMTAPLLARWLAIGPNPEG